MSLPRICIERPVFATMMNLALALLGIAALSRLPVRELPDIDPPIVNVSTVYSGASAEIIESEVTEPLEEAINGVEGIKSLSSESREEFSSITVEFTLSRPIDLAAQDVRDRVARIREVLPDEIDDPVVSKQDSDARPMMWVAMYSDVYGTPQLTKFAEDYLKDSLESVNGVSSVILGGEKRFAVRVRLDSKKMASRRVTVLDVEDALREQNVELPSGRIENRNREFVIQTLASLETIEEFNQLVIREENGRLIRLRDVGFAEAGVEDERSVARYNSKPSVGLGIVKQSKANTIEVARGIKEQVERLQPTLPASINTFVAYDESIFIEDAIAQVWYSLGFAFLLVVITIYVFLGSARSTFIPAITIPIATLSTFLVLTLMGFSINILTMLGLVLAIGIVVDDSIVVLENIYRHVESGMRPFDAAIKGIREITFAVLATTVSLVAVFLPLSFQSSVTGRLFVEFAVALSGAVIISTFIALTLTPSACAHILKAEAQEKKGFLARFESWLLRLATRYEATLSWSLAHRRTVVFLSLGLSALSFLLYERLDKEFLPDEDKGRLFNIAIAPEGATSEHTDVVVRQMEEIVSSNPEVAGYFSAVALAQAGPGLANQGLMFVRFKEDRSRRVNDIVGGPTGIQARFFGEIEGAFAIAILPKAISGGFSQPFQLVLQHPDLVELNALSQEVAGKLRQSGMLQNVRVTFQKTKPEVQVRIERERVADLGVSVDDLSRTLQILFGGQDLSTIKEDGEEFDVIVQLERESRLAHSQLENVFVRNDADELVQLSNLISYETTAGPNQVEHYNRLRSATIEGTPAGVGIGEIVDRTETILEETLPPSVRFAWKGEAEDLKESQSDSLFVILLALAIVYMTLAAQFESLSDPFTVMLTIPLATLGALLGLWLFSGVDAIGQMFYGWANYAPDAPAFVQFLSGVFPRIPSMSINLFSLIGMLLLCGITTKNAILLVDFANQARARGANAVEAMLESGKTRFRPILMTAFATIAGILPIAIGFGAGGESRRAMGIAICFGMMVSTFLSLFLIPVVYSLLADFRERVRGEQSDSPSRKLTKQEL